MYPDLKEKLNIKIKFKKTTDAAIICENHLSFL